MGISDCCALSNFLIGSEMASVGWVNIRFPCFECASAAGLPTFCLHLHAGQAIKSSWTPVSCEGSKDQGRRVKFGTVEKTKNTSELTEVSVQGPAARLGKLS